MGIRKDAILYYRLYFFLVTDEAYRFLNNRWLEKQLQAKKKYADASNISEPSKGGLGANKSLLKKKHRKGKRTKT